MNRARALLAVGIAAAVAAGGLAVMADDDGLARPAASPPAPRGLAEALAAGREWRLELAGGPVRVWVPDGYHPDGAVTVVYAHGYYNDVDNSWINHRLPAQFALSAINAVFISAESPAGSRQKINFPALGDLLVDVFAATKVTRPMGPVVAIGHSGAYRSLLAWMDYPGLEVIVSMDAMYGELDAWREWLAGAATRRLIMVGDDTVRWTEELARDLGGDVVTVDRFPALDEELADLIAEVAAARVVYVRSQFGHMPLVTAGVALPQVLRLLPVEVMARGPWREPLGLPPIDAGAAEGQPRR